MIIIVIIIITIQRRGMNAIGEAPSVVQLKRNMKHEDH